MNLKTKLLLPTLSLATLMVIFIIFIVFLGYRNFELQNQSRNEMASTSAALVISAAVRSLSSITRVIRAKDSLVNAIELKKQDEVLDLVGQFSAHNELSFVNVYDQDFNLFARSDNPEDVGHRDELLTQLVEVTESDTQKYSAILYQNKLTILLTVPLFSANGYAGALTVGRFVDSSFLNVRQGSHLFEMTASLQHTIVQKGWVRVGEIDLLPKEDIFFYVKGAEQGEVEQLLIGFAFLLMLVIVISSYILLRSFQSLNHISRRITFVSEGLPLMIEGFFPEAEPGFEMDDEVGSMLVQIQKVNTAINNYTDELNRGLSEKIDANAELEEAKEKALQMSKSKSEFLANMSHEIRTPLNAVVGFSQLLARCDLSDKQEKYVKKIGVASSSLSELINDILDFSKIEAGKLSLEDTSFDLRDILSTISVLHHDQAIDKGLDLIISCTPGFPTSLVGDPTRIKQIVINLVSNAIKFTESGSVKVIATGVKVEGRLDLVIKVSDTGIGMSESQQEHIFDSFAQADGSTTRHYGGTGLGLTICKHLVQMMQGNLGADSRVGKGTTFSLSLALPLADTVSWKQSEEKRHQVLNDLFVLVGDSSEAFRAHLQTFMSHYHVNVVQADSARVVLDRLTSTSSPFDLILLDDNMCRTGDLSVEEILSASATPVPIILMTDADDESRPLPLDQNMTIVDFPKPFDETKLVNIMAYVLDPDRDVQNSDEQNISSQVDDLEVIPGFSGKHCLIVDDNLFNRELASELVSSLGISIRTAENGKEAIDVIEREMNIQPFDIVLMDMQMPVMDGYEAMTRLKSDKALAKIPLIAVTANALLSDREKCMKAGADDYLPKPIDHIVLESKLYHWLVSEKTEDPQHEEASVKKQKVTLPETSSVDDKQWSGLDTHAALARLAGRKDIYLKVLKSFYADEQLDPQKFNQILSGDDQVEAHRVAHSLKGLASTIGASELEKIAKDVEVRIKNGEDSSTMDVSLINAELAEVWATVGAYIDESDAS